MARTKEYVSWSAMIQRCTNPSNPKYKNYGGRGITIDPKWMRFEDFYAYMGKCPSQKTLNRINNDGGYKPGNCRWATPIEQAQNRRIQKNNKTGIPGVYWNKRNQKYQVEIRANNKYIFLGYFRNKNLAIKVRKKAERKYWGRKEK